MREQIHELEMIQRQKWLELKSEGTKDLCCFFSFNFVDVIFMQLTS